VRKVRLYVTMWEDFDVDHDMTDDELWEGLEGVHKRMQEVTKRLIEAGQYETMVAIMDSTKQELIYRDMIMNRE